MLKLAEIENVQTLEDLYDLVIDQGCGSGAISYEIGGRGGYVGIDSDCVAGMLDVDADCFGLLPVQVGAYCNYLGGGLRGSVCVSNHGIQDPEKAELIDALAEACRRAYYDCENGSGMNDECDDDGEPNWEAIGTNASRRAGIERAY